jgi:hypothetical protein
LTVVWDREHVHSARWPDDINDSVRVASKAGAADEGHPVHARERLGRSSPAIGPTGEVVAMPLRRRGLLRVHSTTTQPRRP